MYINFTTQTQFIKVKQAKKCKRKKLYFSIFLDSKNYSYCFRTQLFVQKLAIFEQIMP